MAAIAVLFNPIVRVHFSRSAWRVINLITAAAFAASMLEVHT